MKIWIVNLQVDPPESIVFFDKERATTYVDKTNRYAVGSWGKAYIAYEGNVTKYDTNKDSL